MPRLMGTSNEETGDCAKKVRKERGLAKPLVMEGMVPPPVIRERSP